MPKFNDIIQTFQNGEVSPKMWGNTQTDMYKRACKNIKNMIVYPQGGVSRRMGTQFLEEYLPTNAAAGSAFRTAMTSGLRFIPFSVSSTESYIIILGKISVDGAYAHSYNVRTGKLSSIPFYEGIISTFANLGVPFEDELALSQISFCAKGDILFLWHPSYPPFRIARHTEDGLVGAHWFKRPSGPPYYSRGTDEALEQARGWPYELKYNLTSTITASGTTGTVTLTSSNSYFTQNMIGTPMAVVNSGTVGYVRITAYTSATVVTAVVLKTLPGTSAYTTWYEAAWSPRRGWPSCGVFWQESLLAGDTAFEPGKIWRSQLGDIYEFSNDDVLDPGATVSAQDPYSGTIASSRNNYISWMTADRNSVLVGTGDREYSINAFSSEEVDVRPQTSVGSDYLQPAIVEDMPLFVRHGGRHIHELIYQERLNGYISPETTFFAEHITRKSEELVTSPVLARIKGLTFQKTPNLLIWAWDTNGYLYSCTRRLTGEITAWHRHELGGTYATNDFPFVLSAASVTSSRGSEEELFLLVRRTIDSVDKIFLEKMSASFSWSTTHPDGDTKYREPIYLDCSKVFRPHSPSTFRAKLKSSINADTASGVATGTATGTIVFLEGIAQFASAANSYISYDADLNADSQQVGCIRCTYYPDRNATVVDTILSISQAASNTNNLIQLSFRNDSVFTGSGIVVHVKDSTGSDIIPSTVVAIPSEITTSTGPYRIEFNYDFTTGASRLFLNGKQLGSTFSQTGTRSSSIALLRLGATPSAGSISRGGIADVEIFDSVQHTSDFELYEYQETGLVVEGLDYLEGETVGVLGDGKYLGTYTVASGEITLENEYSTIIVGLPYSHYVEPLPIEAGSGIGSSQGRIKRVDTLALKFYNTSHCKFGRDLDNQEEIPFRNPTDDLGEPIKLFTGEKVLPIEGGYESDSTIVISGDDPLPCNVTCLVARGVTYDG